MSKQRFSRLIASFEKQNKYLTFGDNTPEKQVLLKAINHLKKNWKKTNDKILAIIMELQLKGDDVNDVNAEEKIKRLSYLTATIKNFSLHLNDTSKRCRYSPHITSISLSLYIRSKTSYKDIPKSGLIMLPSSYTMKKVTAQFRINPGLDPNIMYILKDQLKNMVEDINGHLIMDEIKSKNGIMWNCINNEVTGFAEEDLKKNDLLKNILDIKDNKKVDEKQVSVYVNQWRFRSTRGITHNSNFYLNKGSLDSN